MFHTVSFVCFMFHTFLNKNITNESVNIQVSFFILFNENITYEYVLYSILCFCFICFFMTILRKSMFYTLSCVFVSFISLWNYYVIYNTDGLFVVFLCFVFVFMKILRTVVFYALLFVCLFFSYEYVTEPFVFIIFIAFGFYEIITYEYVLYRSFCLFHSFLYENVTHKYVLYSIFCLLFFLSCLYCKIPDECF